MGKINVYTKIVMKKKQEKRENMDIKEIYT